MLLTWWSEGALSFSWQSRVMLPSIQFSNSLHKETVIRSSRIKPTLSHVAVRQHFSLSLLMSDLERCWTPMIPLSFQENSSSWRSLKKPMLGQSMLYVPQLSGERIKLLPPWGMHFDIYRFIYAVWIILLFLLQKERCLSGIRARKTHKDRRRYNSFPQIQVINTLFYFKTV